MYIYNITFVISPEAKERFLEWIRSSALPTLMDPAYAASSPRLQAVVEVGGEKPSPEHGLSMALHFEFGAEKEAHLWHDSLLPEVLSGFTREFGPHAAFFITLLETVSL